MKKVIWTIVILAAAVGAIWFFLDEAEPEGIIKGSEAEILTDKMFDAIGEEAWRNIPFVAWSFRGVHFYIWDKMNDVVQVKWDDNIVVLNLSTLEGDAYRDSIPLGGDEAADALKKAWGYFANDSFWLNAPAKARDPGTERSIATDEKGEEGLKVRYTTGGVTPGDTYLWLFDEDYKPRAVKMWVSIIPVGGTEATWTGWRDLQGAQVATRHEMGPISIPIGDLRSGHSPADFDLPADYFTSRLAK